MKPMKFDGPVRPELKYAWWERMVGKTVAKVEAGERLGSPDRHRAEEARIYFTDGTAMNIIIGSNVGNLVIAKGLRRGDDVHCDLTPFWQDHR